MGGSYLLGKNLKISLTAVLLTPTDDESAVIGNALIGWFNTNHRVDAGFAVISSDFSVIPVPTISYAYRFGEGR
jgi:hypothetical protein